MSVKDKAKRRVFVSYAIEDSAYASELINSLAQQPNLHVFTTDKMSAGENWRLKIKRALSDSDFFLVLLSPTSVQSKWVQFELGAAWGLNKPIIPVVTSHEVVNRIPLDLGELHVVDLDELKKPEAISRIFRLYEKTAA